MARRNKANVLGLSTEVARKLTVVVAIDAKTMDQFRITHPTWRLHYPELWTCKWLLIHDVEQITSKMANELIDAAELQSAQLAPWGPSVYSNQREKMLSGFIHLPHVAVKTKWWLKIDTDAVALERHPILEENLLDDSVGNCYIASSWGYTKAKGGGGDAHQWAKQLENWGDNFAPGTKHVGLREKVDGRRIKHGRMASWFSAYRTEWTTELAEACIKHRGYKLPVPSQDTVAWYFGERRKDKVHIERKYAKRRGWNNFPSMDKLRQKVSEVMNA